jgi:hypothetical protein
MSATRKLTRHDADTIRDLHEWKQKEIERINSIGSARALAEKFDVSIRAIESVLSYRTHRGQI